LAIGIESRVTARLLGDSHGLAQLFVSGRCEPRGIFEQACARRGFGGSVSRSRKLLVVA
jgi:hypothetical protein